MDSEFTPITETSLFEWLGKSVTVSLPDGKLTGILYGIGIDGRTSRGLVLTLSIDHSETTVFSWLCKIMLNP